MTDSSSLFTRGRATPQSVPTNRSSTPRLSVRKKIFFTCVVTLVVPAVLLLSAELLGRLVIHWRYGVPGKSYGIYAADAELGAVHRPNSYNHNSVINNWGFRNLEDIAEEKPAGALRIYCSGGSTTFCYNLLTEDAWPTLLQRQLRKVPGHEADEVLNAGEISFSVAHEYRLARRLVPRLRPDVAIINTGCNELLALQKLADEGHDIDGWLAEGHFDECPTNLGQANAWLRNSVVCKFWDYKIKGWFAQRLMRPFHDPSAKKITIHPWSSQNFDFVLAKYIGFLRESDCRVIVFRFGDSGEPSPYLRDVVRPFRDQAVAVARANGAEVCDVVDRVAHCPDRGALFIDSGVHVTRRGAERYAGALARCVLAGPCATQQASKESSRRCVESQEY